MTLWHAAAIFAAGLAAGTINTVVGSGTLITFPVLLAFGYPAVSANASNAIGLVPGSVSGAVGYRAELAGQRPRLVSLLSASLAGAAVGAVLLLTLPASAFRAIVPVFIALALALIIFQPRIARMIERWRARQPGGVSAEPGVGPALWAGVFLAGVYGGYFGAAQGILLLAFLGLAFTEPLQRLNALKVILAGLVNLTSGVIFVFAAPVAWGAVALIAAGSVLGGVLGATVGRRLDPGALRALIVVVGVVAIARLL